ncbi:HlyC/CorC family transporter [Sesbania bispinosa]|nr:HlyC/CorC family transporter [Sesbania bispinosa]
MSFAIHSFVPVQFLSHSSSAASEEEEESCKLLGAGKNRRATMNQCGVGALVARGAPVGHGCIAATREVAEPCSAARERRPLIFFMFFLFFT